jgi:DNA-binding MarR family transcriptional regulator
MQETMVTSGTITNRLDGLEDLKLIIRAPDPEDGRGSLVKLTAAGVRAVDKAMEDLLDRERGLLASLTKDERADLADLLSQLASTLEENS